jgi:hypothetical protein
MPSMIWDDLRNLALAEANAARASSDETMIMARFMFSPGFGVISDEVMMR